MSTKKNTEINNTKFSCEFCKREFLKESTVFKHICEYKRRWLDKDSKSNRIGFQTWLEFYKRNSASKKKRTYEEFIRSAYYSAFVKFGIYCVNVNVINMPRFIDWLLKNKIKIDTWNTDTTYSRFLIDYLRNEDPYDAAVRSVEHAMTLCESENIQVKDYLRYINKNKICYDITAGKISPWILYQSDSGVKFLDSLDETQIKMIFDYINPELWLIKFKKDIALTNKIKDLCKQIGF